MGKIYSTSDLNGYFFDLVVIEYVVYYRHIATNAIWFYTAHFVPSCCFCTSSCRLFEHRDSRL